MAVTFLATPAAYTPTTAGWFTIDLSASPASIPAGATGVIIHYYNSSSAARYIGFRKYGSTDDRYQSLLGYTHGWLMVGVDGDRKIGHYGTSSGYIDFWVVGYTTDDCVFFDNGIAKTPGSTNTWTTIDISDDTGEDTAIGAIFECTSTAAHSVGVRKYGQTAAPLSYVNNHSWFVCGVDDSEQAEGYVVSTTNDAIYLIGYIKSGATFPDEITDLSMSGTGSYADLTTLPAGATGGIIHAYISGTPTNNQYNIQAKGATENVYNACKYSTAVIVPGDANRVIEGKIAETTCDFALLGYFGTASTTTPQSVGGATITPTGALSKVPTYARGAGGANITPTGALLKTTRKSMGGATITPAGIVKKQSYKATGGATITPAGVTAQSAVLTQVTGGATITPAGTLAKTIGKMVGKAVIAPTGSIAKIIGKLVGKAVITPVGEVAKGSYKATGGATITPTGAVSTVKIDGGTPPVESTIKRIQHFLKAIKNNDT